MRASRRKREEMEGGPEDGALPPGRQSGREGKDGRSGGKREEAAAGLKPPEDVAEPPASGGGGAGLRKKNPLYHPLNDLKKKRATRIGRKKGGKETGKGGRLCS